MNIYEQAQSFGCSKSDIEAALKRLSISKKKSLEHPKVCPTKRTNCLSKLNNYIAQGFAILYVDESDFEYETIRPHVCADIEIPCIACYNWQGKKALASLVLYTRICYSHLNSSRKNQWRYTL